MNSEFRLPLNRYTLPAIIGMLVMFVWAVLQSLCGVISGPLGDSAGVLLFGHTVGNISRYCDPFVLGAFATIVAFCWNKIPPVRPYGWLAMSNRQRIAFCFLVGPVSYRVWKTVLGSNFVALNCDEFFMVWLVAIQFLPFGMRGAIGIVGLAGSVLLHFTGSVPAILFVTLVYIIKWINWWVVNFIRYGFKGARSALRPNGDMSVMQ